MNETNGSSVPHQVNPDEINNGGSSETGKRWINGRLADQLQDSVGQVKQGDYKRAKRLIGKDSEYEKLAKRYANVSGESGQGTDGKRFGRLQRNQTQLITNVRSYQETLKKYRKAKRNGNDARARTLARDLEHYSDRAKRNGSALKRDYERISSNDTEIANSKRRIENLTQNITKKQSKIREREFIETQFSDLEASKSGSFTDPIKITGQLRAANGSVLQDRKIRLEIRNQSIQSEIGQDGRFEATYRPTLVKAGTQRLTIEYAPRNDSVYLGTNESINLTVRQAKPTVKITEKPNTARYRKNITVKGTVKGDGVGASGVPVRVTVGNTPLNTTRTNKDGTFTVDKKLPTEVRAGNQQVRAQVALANKALMNASDVAPMNVTKTATRLSINTRRTENRLRVQGTLMTATGARVANQTVEIRIAGRTITTAETDANGHFSAVVSLPKDTTNEDRPVTIATVYSGAMSNLESTKARTQLHPTGPTDGVPNWWLWVGSICLFGFVAGGAYVIWSRNVLGFGPNSMGEITSDDSLIPTGGDNEPVTTNDLLTTAREQLAANRSDVAVRTAYKAVRYHLARDSANQLHPGKTHWELYHDYRTSDADDDTTDKLRRLAQAYEIAAFTTSSISIDDAQTSVDIASSLVSESNTE
ncbi:hypothetical protein [Haladaptatus sp. NG-WS-4]